MHRYDTRIDRLEAIYQTKIKGGKRRSRQGQKMNQCLGIRQKNYDQTWDRYIPKIQRIDTIIVVRSSSVWS
jgi:hypothetical protein